MMYRNNEILVTEISGKRPGGKKERPTEYFPINYDHLIVSNDSEGYKTEWEILNVPEEYRDWYVKNIKSSENAWYAPMNRSYAIKYAKENGYKYLVQLDDNILKLKIAYNFKCEGYQKRYISEEYVKNSRGMLNDFIDMLVCILDNTNAGMAGCNMMGASAPHDNYLSERYCYSLFALKLGVVPECFQGDFEDDIDYRLKLADMKIPTVQCCCLMYGKTAQRSKDDLTGCRGEYVKAGIKRGEHMRKIRGDVYSAGISSRGNAVAEYKNEGVQYFRHKLKPIKIGVQMKDKKAIDDKMRGLLKKYAVHIADQVSVKEKSDS